MKIIKKIFLLCLLFFPISTFALSTPIERVFKDIDTNYKYYDELQTLYDKGMFTPDKDGKFNPRKLLKRDEFVGIVSEVSCKKCIQPDVSYDYFSKYNNTQSFFDIDKSNKYSYCIAGAVDEGQVTGYYKGDVCEDGTSKPGVAPFCPNNTIILEEALAIMLRTSNILTKEQADFIRTEISSGKKFPDISEDVVPLLPSGQVYSFYPDFREASQYEISEYDTSGNEKIYKLLEKRGGKFYPKKAVSKEEFLKMAYVVLKGNSCIENNFYNVGLKMRVLNQTCNEKISARCRLSSLRTTKKIFDFDAVVKIPVGDSISRKEGYVWRFYNFQTGEEKIRYGKYLDNYNFLKDGNYRVFLTINTDKGNSGKVYNDISIVNGKIQPDQEKITNIKVSIDASPIGGKKGTKIKFKGIASSPAGIISYFWNYGDGKTSYGIANDHIYDEEGVYEVTLLVTDGDGNTATAVVLISIYDSDKDDDGVIDTNDSCPNLAGPKDNEGCPKTDTDGDGVDDIDDKCPTTLGTASNNGCPAADDDNDDDTDGDGVTDNDDKCKNKKGPKTNNGCPYPDTDGDGVTDNNDKCKDIFGVERNDGCPIYDTSCDSDEDCPNGYYCSNGICKRNEFVRNCNYSGGNLFYGNVSCSTCPCDKKIDFNAELKNCDIVFPAITSPSETKLYSKGDYYRINTKK